MSTKHSPPAGAWVMHRRDLDGWARQSHPEEVRVEVVLQPVQYQGLDFDGYLLPIVTSSQYDAGFLTGYLSGWCMGRRSRKNP